MAKNKLFICKDFNYSPEYIDKMPFYEYEWLIQDINEFRKKEDEERKKQEKEAKTEEKQVVKQEEREKH